MAEPQPVKPLVKALPRLGLYAELRVRLKSQTDRITPRQFGRRRPRAKRAIKESPDA